MQALLIKLCICGQAVKDDRGILRIQRPHKGPFYVSPKSIDQLITNLGRWSRWYKYLSLGFTAFGIFMITSHVVKQFLEKRRRAALQRRVLEAAAQRLENGADPDGMQT
jgi:E3 ubiquitin-protein ligase MUL1